jgi:ornithine cyclodeaminase/alanine dehydrogenase-like protein (mu-crystallin family)
MSAPPVLLLSRRELAALLTPRDYLGAAEAAFRALGERRANAPQPLHIAAPRGGFHAKGASFQAERSYVALKFNANFPGNPELTGMPTIQGAILLCDGENGALLSILDSVEVTLRRTAAASALAARLMARPISRTLMLCGCGVQALAHAEAMADSFPLEEILCWDRDVERAKALARHLCCTLPLHAAAAAELASAARRSDIIVTSTTATAPFLGVEHVRPGVFIAAVGADNSAKSEIAPSLFAAAAVVCDSASQCAAMGDLNHAIACGAVSLDHVRAELSEVVRGARLGRDKEDEIIVFDSTGLAAQDAAAAAFAYERALIAGCSKAYVLNDA